MRGLLASADLIIWIIIAIVVALSKAFSKFQESAGEGEEPAAPPKPRPKKPRPQPPVAPAPATPPPLSRQPPRVPPPVEPRTETWKAPETLEEFLHQLPQAQPVRPVPVPSPPPPPAAKPREHHAPPPKKPQPAPAAAAPRLSKSRQWALALQDRDNIRNAIVAAEILGPPGGVALRESERVW